MKVKRKVFDFRISSLKIWKTRFKEKLLCLKKKYIECLEFKKFLESEIKEINALEIIEEDGDS